MKNGALRLQFDDDWIEDHSKMMNGIYSDTQELVNQRNYSKDMCEVLKEIKETLLSAAVGRNHIPQETAEALFNRYERTSHTVYKILGTIIIVLLSVVVAPIIGDKAGGIVTVIGRLLGGF